MLIGELGYFRAASVEFNANLPEVARRVPRCGTVRAKGLQDKGDKLHFNSPSLRIFGQRYAEALKKVEAND